MHKIPAVILFILSFGTTISQTAIINDPDGFSNIRDKANGQSSITDTVANGRLVYVFKDMVEGNWLPVEYNKGKKIISGFIHSSRIIYLNSLTPFKEVKQRDSAVELQLDAIQIMLQTKKFSEKGRVIKYEKTDGQNYVKSIDNQFPWGTDNSMPRFEFKAIQVRIKDKVIPFPPNTYQDLFNPNPGMTKAWLDKKTGKVYIETLNGSDASACVVVWVLKSEQVVGREIFIPSL